MKNLGDNLAAITLTLWVGSMWAVGYMVAPTLFNVLDDRALAGMLAGHMFTLEAYVGMACGFYLLLFRIARTGPSVFKQSVFWLVLAMLILTVASHFGIQPILAHLKEEALPKEVMKSVFRDRFATWHGVSSIVYMIQSLLGLVLVAKTRTASR
jgi:hypothetical protein